MRRGLLWQVLALAAVLGATVLAAAPAPPGPAPAPRPQVVDAPTSLPPVEPPGPPAPPPAEESPGASEPAPVPGPGPGDPPDVRLLESVLPLWEIYRAAVAADDELLNLARKLEAGEMTFWGFALAARRTGARQRDHLRRFSTLAREAPAEVRGFAAPATGSLEHRVRAAWLAERAALTLSETGYLQALEEHRLAVGKGVSATVNLIALFQQYEIPWPPLNPPR